MIAGVCTGLAAFFGVDVTIVRIVFLVLVVLTKGFWALAYGVLMFVIPSANTAEERAAAHGEPFNAQELDRSREEELRRHGRTDVVGELAWHVAAAAAGLAATTARGVACRMVESASSPADAAIQLRDAHRCGGDDSRVQLRQRRRLPGVHVCGRVAGDVTGGVRTAASPRAAVVAGAAGALLRVQRGVVAAARGAAGVVLRGRRVSPWDGGGVGRPAVGGLRDPDRVGGVPHSAGRARPRRRPSGFLGRTCERTGIARSRDAFSTTRTCGCSSRRAIRAAPAPRARAGCAAPARWPCRPSSCPRG